MPYWNGELKWACSTSIASDCLSQLLNPNLAADLNTS